VADAVKGYLKRLAARAVAEYRINWIFAIDRAGTDVVLPASQRIVPLASEHATLLDQSATDQVRGSLSYARAVLRGFVLLDGGRPVSVAHFAEPAQYDRTETWPLRAGEVALMDIVTEESARGGGLAARLLEQTAAYYLQSGTKRLIAFIWWSNEPSVRAFRKSGWHRIGLSIEWRIGARWFRCHVPLRSRSASCINA
jgi:GNAT superfamily N-acetyltransferase